MRRLLAIAIVWWLCVLSGATSAQDDVAAAREAEAQAREAFRKRDFQTAARGFETAFRLDPRANTKYNEALAWQEAAQPAPAADAFATALSLGGLDAELAESGAAALADLEKQLGKLSVRAPEGASVSVAHADHRRIPATVHLAPGTHAVTVHHVDGSQIQREVDVVAGGEQVVGFDAPVAPPRPAPTSTTSPDQATPPDDGVSALGVTGWTLVGLGGAALVAMGVTGAMTLGKVGDYDDGGNTDAALRDEAVTLKTTTNVLLGVGAGLGAVGVVLLLVDALAGEDGGQDESAALRIAPDGALRIVW